MPAPRKRTPQGVRARHSRACASRAGGGCSCRPSYEAFVYLKREDRKVRKTFPTQAAAKAWRTDALHAAGRGRLRVPSHVTLRQAAEEWLAGVREGAVPNRTGRLYKPATLRGYERGLTLRLLPALGDRRLTEITRADVQTFAEALTAEGLSASTIQNTLDPLRVIYRRAIRRDLVAVDPTEGLELRRPDGHRDRIADPAEAALLLAALPDFERSLWATAMYAGLRRGELRGLLWRDVDLPGRRIRVERAWDDVEGAQDGKSAAAERTVPILDLLAPELAAHKLRTAGKPDALVFGLTAERPFYPETARRHALDAWAAAGLEPISLHEGRHTCASLLIAAGANAKVIQRVMGHATIGMTFDTYGHLMPDGLDEAAQAANAYLSARQTRASDRPV